MEQHAIPRQITTFEFKLIGFMTIKQFIYLIVFFPLAIIFYKLFPIPIINLLLAIIVGGLGVILAFVPINDRPADVWIRNFWKRLSSPTQYFYHKQNEPLYFINNLVFNNDPHRVMAHIESQEKLNIYLSQKNSKKSNQKKTTRMASKKKILAKATKSQKTERAVSLKTNNSTSLPKKEGPFFSGEVKNHRGISLPGVLIYVKDNASGRTLRLLKTNPNGVFATFKPLPPGEYIFEFKDTKGKYLFDKKILKLDNQNSHPLEFISKEMI